jgi:hypothetical protein
MSRPADLIGKKARALGLANDGLIDGGVTSSVINTHAAFENDFRAGEHGGDDNRTAS